MKLKEGFVLREVAGENVVLPSSDTVDLSMMITLNETGRFLWEKLAEGAEIDDLVAALLAEYDVSEQDARTHTIAFVEKLKKNGFLA